MDRRPRPVAARQGGAWEHGTAPADRSTPGRPTATIRCDTPGRRPLDLPRPTKAWRWRTRLGPLEVNQGRRARRPGEGQGPRRARPRPRAASSRLDHRRRSITLTGRDTLAGGSILRIADRPSTPSRPSARARRRAGAGSTARGTRSGHLPLKIEQQPVGAFSRFEVQTVPPATRDAHRGTNRAWVEQLAAWGSSGTPGAILTALARLASPPRGGDMGVADEPQRATLDRRAGCHFRCATYSCTGFRGLPYQRCIVATTRRGLSRSIHYTSAAVNRSRAGSIDRAAHDPGSPNLVGSADPVVP